MIYLQERSLKKQIRGDAVRLKPSGRRVTLLGHTLSATERRSERGFTLIELVITITVLTILTMGVVPLMKLSVKRQKEQQLHEALRQIRSAIDEFHRDTVGIVCTGNAAAGAGQPVPQAPVDPRSKVVISDCTIFGVDNPDRFPPDLETLVAGVNVIPRGSPGGVGGRGLESTGTGSSDTSSVLGSQLSTKKKVYLRSIPIDPMTGERDWCMLSNYDDPTIDCTGGQENVFDVHSKSKEKALNGEKYSDW